AEQRPLLRGGQPFMAQLLLRGVQGGAVAFVRDLTAGLEQADATLRAEDIARFASLVAHEVRNPLSAVKIALQTLERHGTLGQNDLRRTSIALREVRSEEHTSELQSRENLVCRLLLEKKKKKKKKKTTIKKLKN